MINVTSTKYEPGEAFAISEWQRDAWLHGVVKWLEVHPEEQVFYERQGDTLVIAARLGGEIRWFDCVMKRNGRVRKGRP